MNFITSTHGIPLTAFKRTKIIATVGPSTNSYKQIAGMIRAGANGLRLNFSHGSHDEHAKWIAWIRQASRELGKPVAIIQDLQGPKVRCGDFEGTIEIHKGDRLNLEYNADYAMSGHVPTQYDLSKKVHPGERVYLYDGRIRTVVASIAGKVVTVEAENDGGLVKRKGINLPDTDFGGDVIPKKDKADLAFGATQDIDYVAQSFVQSAADLRAMRRLMSARGMDAKLIVKFETRAAMNHMEEIVQEADVVMIARGDLGGETSAETVPIVQRQLIGLGLRYAKPTIVATQMLLSMTASPEPTRAEVSDVSTAVLLGADCVMLSEETAAGQFPLEAVKTMKRIILANEHSISPRVIWPEFDDHTQQGSIARAAVRLSESIQAKAFIANTKSGATALHIASRRLPIPVLSVTTELRTAQQLTIVFATKSYVKGGGELDFTPLIEWLKAQQLVKRGDALTMVTGSQPGVAGTTDTIKVHIVE